MHSWFKKSQITDNWSDPNYVLKQVEQNGIALRYASPELKNNPQIVLKAVKQDGYALEYASPELKNNPQIVLESVKQNGNALQYASPELKNNPQFVLEAVKQDGYALHYASPELRSNPQIVLEAVKQDGFALQYASPELRSNTQIVLEAVKKHGYVLQFASPELRSNTQIVLEAVKQNGNALQFASPELRSNPQIVLEAVKKLCYVLQFASPELRNNTQIVLEAVKQNGFVLQFASPELKNNPQIVLEAVKQNGLALAYASPELRNNPQIALEAIKQNGFALAYASEELKNNPQIVFEAVKKDGYALQFASDELKNNPQIVFEAVKKDGYALHYASPELRSNTQIVFEAVKKDGFALQYASPELKNNPSFIASIIPDSTSTFQYSNNTKYHKLKNQNFINKLKQLQQAFSLPHTTPKEKQYKNNLISKIKSELTKYKLYNQNINSVEDIDQLLKQNDPSRSFRSNQQTWEKDYGQNFTDSDETVYPLYWSKELFLELSKDPLVSKFLMHQPQASHFLNITAPVGWALVYKKSPDTWIINQIQSDLITDFYHMINEIDKTKTEKIDSQELFTRLNANQRSAYIKLLGEPKYRDLHIKLLHSPNLLFELPVANTEQDAREHLNRMEARAVELQGANVVSVGERQTLKDLSLDQLRYIEGKLSWVINEWPDLVFHNVWLEAKKAGVEHLYMNTKDSVDGGLSEEARGVLYEHYPKQWGFAKVPADLRGSGEENFWHRTASTNNWLKVALWPGGQLIDDQYFRAVREKIFGEDRYKQTYDTGEPEKNIVPQTGFGSRWRENNPGAGGKTGFEKEEDPQLGVGSGYNDGGPATDEDSPGFQPTIADPYYATNVLNELFLDLKLHNNDNSVNSRFLKSIMNGPTIPRPHRRYQTN